MNKTGKYAAAEVVKIVAAAGGKLVGRTRLQKTAFLLELAGLGSGFRFTYKHYGPFSEELASAVDIAPLLFDSFKEEQVRADWGGTYSIFSCDEHYEGDDKHESLVSMAKSADPISLELAATAAYLASTGEKNPWSETERRKPEKAGNGRLGFAQDLYRKLKELPVRSSLPDI